jgi:hypothetical protein
MAFDRFDHLSLSQFIASELSPGALWIFVHIPRTAGSSFITEFAELRPNHKYLRVDATEEQLPYAKKMNRTVEQFARELEARAYTGCSGHIKMTHVKRIRSVEPGAKVITLIRNPVDRVVSDFRHARSQAHPPHRDFIQKYPTIHDYVDAPESQDKVARFLAHRAGTDSSDLLKVIGRSVSFIGLTEMYPMSFNIISRLLGQNRFPRVHKLAAASADGSDVNVDAALRRRIISNNETDVQLYEYVKTKLIAKRAEWKDLLVAEKRTIPEMATQALPHDDLIRETAGKPKKRNTEFAPAHEAATAPAIVEKDAAAREQTELALQERARLAGLIHRVRWLEQERTRMGTENARLSSVARSLFASADRAADYRGSILERVRLRRTGFVNLLRDTEGATQELSDYARLVNYDPRRVAAYRQDVSIQGSSVVSEEDKTFAHAVRDLFDPEFYVNANGLAEETIGNPLLHYVIRGRLDGLQPNALFDREHYLSQTGKLAESPLLHYSRSGQADGFSPHPLLDARFYARQCDVSGGNTVNALFHYQTTGGLQRLNPSPLFDTAYYLSRFEHPEDIEIPLEHYVLGGRSAPDPHPLFSADHLRLNEMMESLPEAALVSYLKHRALQFERDPHPLFSVRHLVRIGCVSAEDPRSPVEQYLAASLDRDIDPHPTFDSAFYRYQVENERGVKLTVPPVLHYLTVGFNDKTLQPHPLFDPTLYLKANGLQPAEPELVRYLLKKDGEGLRCHELFDSRFYDSQRMDDGSTETGTTALEHWADASEKIILTDSRLRTPLDSTPLDLLARAIASAEEFDVDFYRRLYREFGEYDEIAAREHYENHGKREGRHGSARTLLGNTGLRVAGVPIGFFPAEYIELHPDLEVWRDQPMRCLLHYLEHGRLENRQIGYWQLKLDDIHLDIPTREAPLVPTPPECRRRLCILIHIYYPELWPELAGFVKNLGGVSSDVFINVTDTQWTPQLQTELRDLCPGAFVLVSPNRGRDIGGHLRLLEHVDIGRYETFALMHTKKSRHLAAAKGAAWRQGLIAAFAGSETTAEECMSLFQEQSRIGIVGAAGWRAHSMNGNQVEVDRLMARLGIEGGNRRLDFVSGTMFLIRSEIVARLYREFRDTEWRDPAGQDAAFFLDGQLEHAIERVIPSLARQMGYEIVWR